MKTIIRTFTLIAVIIGLSACSSRRNAPGASSTVNRADLKGLPPVEALAATYAPWQTFYAPFSMQCSRPLALSVSGRATMVRDRYIYLSMRLLGFEIASAYVDTDSAYVADKYNKTLVVEPLSAITARTGLTLGDIQDLLMGRAFYPGRGTLCSINKPQTLFAPVAQENMTLLVPQKTADGVSWFFNVDSSPSLRRITIEPEGYSPFLVDFSGIVDATAGAIASDVMITGRIGTRDIEAMMEWNLDKAKWNESVSDPNPSYKGYRRLSAGRLIDALKSGF